MYTFESYQDFEKSCSISGVSPEALYAEAGWNAAVRRITELFTAGLIAEDGDAMKARHLLQTELEALDTGMQHPK